MNNLIHALPLGVGATAFMDLWGLLRKPLLGQPVPDYRMVGRWVGLMRHGTFRHEAIAGASPVLGERAIGWAVHYLTGIFFAAVLLAVANGHWLQQPTPCPAMAVGLASIVAPFLLMQPAMGAGIAASRTPDPRRARLQSLVTHAVFGLGLYLAAEVLRLITP